MAMNACSAEKRVHLAEHFPAMVIHLYTMALHQSPPNRTSAEPPSDETISIRVSSRPPKPRKFPEDYLGEGVVYFGEDGVRQPLCSLPTLLRTNRDKQRPEPTAKRQAEPPVEQPPLKRRGRPRKRAQGHIYMNYRPAAYTSQSYADWPRRY